MRHGIFRYFCEMMILMWTVLSLLSCIACAQGEEDFKWEKQYKKGITINKYIGEEKDVTVPAYIDGTPVTEIGFMAFKEQGVTSVTLPDTVKTIDYQAFQDCATLEAVVLPDGLKEIRDLAFWNCASLDRLVIPAGIESIGEEIFRGCGDVDISFSGRSSRYAMQDDMLIDKKRKTVLAYMGHDAHVTVPEGILRIGRYAFHGRAEMTEITLPKSLQGIGYSAFEDCVNLRSVHLPGKINIIEGGAFLNCWNLERINIPDNVKIIELNVFNGCPKLQIEIAENHKLLYVRDNMLIEKPYYYPNMITYETAHGSWSEDMSSDDYTLISIWGEHDRDFVVPPDVTSVYALGGIEGLRSVTFHENVEYIDDIFDSCPDLKEIAIMGKNTRINGFAFDGHEELIVHAYEDSEACRFAQEKGIACEYIGSGQKGQYAILAQSNGTCIITKYDGDDENVVIPQTIDGYRVVEIGEGVFRRNAAIRSVVVPDGVVDIDDQAFSVCTALETVSLPDTLSRIGSNAFAGCTALREINLPQSLTTIRLGAFRNCASLEEIVWPQYVYLLERTTFEGCTKLKFFHIHDGIEYIENSVFLSCPELQVTISDTQPYFEIRDGMLIEKRSQTPVMTLSASAHVEIPHGTTKIEADAFNGNTTLTSITLPDTLEQIGYSAFEGCKNLQHIRLPEGLKMIRDDAFLGCESLQSINIPDSVKNIGSDAFDGCRNLTIEISADHPMYLLENDCVVKRPNVGGYADQALISWLGKGDTLVVPDGVNYLGRYDYPEGLQNLSLPASIKHVGMLDIPMGKMNSLTFRGMETTFERDALNSWFPPLLRVLAGSAAEKLAIEHGLAYELIEE